MKNSSLNGNNITKNPITQLKIILVDEAIRNCKRGEVGLEKLEKKLLDSNNSTSKRTIEGYINIIRKLIRDNPGEPFVKLKTDTNTINGKTTYFYDTHTLPVSAIFKSKKLEIYDEISNHIDNKKAVSLTTESGINHLFHPYVAKAFKDQIYIWGFSEYQDIYSNDEKYFSNILSKEKKQYDEYIGKLENILKNTHQNFSDKVKIKQLEEIKQEFEEQVNLIKKGKLIAINLNDIKSLKEFNSPFITCDEEDLNFYIHNVYGTTYDKSLKVVELELNVLDTEVIAEILPKKETEVTFTRIFNKSKCVYKTVINNELKDFLFSIIGKISIGDEKIRNYIKQKSPQKIKDLIDSGKTQYQLGDFKESEKYFLQILEDYSNFIGLYYTELFSEYLVAMEYLSLYIYPAISYKEGNKYLTDGISVETVKKANVKNFKIDEILDFYISQKDYIGNLGYYLAYTNGVFDSLDKSTFTFEDALNTKPEYTAYIFKSMIDNQEINISDLNISYEKLNLYVLLKAQNDEILQNLLGKPQLEKEIKVGILKVEEEMSKERYTSINAFAYLLPTSKMKNLQNELESNKGDFNEQGFIKEIEDLIKELKPKGENNNALVSVYEIGFIVKDTNSLVTNKEALQSFFKNRA